MLIGHYTTQQRHNQNTHTRRQCTFFTFRPIHFVALEAFFLISLSLTTTLSHDVVLKNAFHHISCNAIPLISVMASCSSLFVTSNISRRDELFFPQLVTHRLQATLVKLVKIYSRIKYTSILCNTLLCYLTQHTTFVGNQKHVGF